MSGNEITLTRNKVNDGGMQCEQCNAIYPARLTLTTKALKATSESGAVPTLPAGIPADGSDDYDLRPLRDGFIYILAEDCATDPTTDPVPTNLNILPTARVNNGKAWYIFRYRSPDVDAKANQGTLPMNYQFCQYHCQGYDLRKAWKLDTLNWPCIRINKQVDQIEIAYSDFEWPLDLLDALVADAGKRSQWMRSVNILTPAGASAPIATLRDRVKDLVFETGRHTKDSDPSNDWRHTPIGSREELTPLANQILTNHTKGAVVAVEDSIGTMRDLANYQQYLDFKRKHKLKEYEYSIMTAQIVDAHAQQVLLKTNEDIAHRNNYSYSANKFGIQEKPIDFPAAYQKLADEIGNHLQASSDNDVIELLKTEFELDDLPGINPINKIANLPGQYGRPFKNLVNVHASLINDTNNQARLQTLMDIGSGKAFSAFFLYMHGMLWGINQSASGENALIEAFAEDGSILSEAQKSAVQETAKSLKLAAAKIKSAVGAAAKLAELASLNLVSFDLMVETLSNTLVISTLSQNQNGTTRRVGFEYQRTQAQITEIYKQRGIRATPFETNTSVTPQPANSSTVTQKLPEWQPYTVEKSVYSSNTRSVSTVQTLTINDHSYQQFQNINKKLDGAAKYLGFMTLLGLLYDNTARTNAGKLAYDPILQNSLMLAIYFKPASPLAFEVSAQTGRLIAVEAGGLSKPFTSGWAAARAGLLNIGTGLAGLGVLLEIGIAKEMKHKGDTAGYYGALFRGTGSGLIAIAPATLAAGLMVQLPMVAMALTGLGMLFWGAGIALILLGVAFSLLSKSDMELWLQNSFWGNSNEYWGNPVGSYQWVTKREKDFSTLVKASKFDLTAISSSEAFTAYQIEMQRYFSFASGIGVSASKPNVITVTHPSLIDDTIAQSIQIEQLVLHTKTRGWYDSDAKPTITFDPETPGMATLTFTDPWPAYEQSAMHYPGMTLDVQRPRVTKDQNVRLAIFSKELKKISIKVAIPEYTGSDGTIRSKYTELTF